MNKDAIKNKPLARPMSGASTEDADREDCRELLETIAKGMVDYPDCISVSYEVGEKTTVFKLDCEQRCIGQIIGSKGKNINGIRAIISAIMARKGIRAIVEIPYYSAEASS